MEKGEQREGEGSWLNVISAQTLGQMPQIEVGRFSSHWPELTDWLTGLTWAAAWQKQQQQQMQIKC